MDTREPTTKELIDAYAGQAELAYRSWNDRRQYEWKLTLGFWTLLILGVGFFARDVKVKPANFIVVALFGYLTYARWLLNLWGANEFDRQTQFHYRDQTRMLLVGVSSVGNFPYQKRDDPKFTKLHLGLWKFLKHWSMSTQLLVTFLLLLVCYFFATGDAGFRGEERLKAIEDAVKESGGQVERCLTKLDLLQNEIRSLQSQKPQEYSGKPASGR